jgi:type I restriction enzyme S subunit
MSSKKNSVANKKDSTVGLVPALRFPEFRSAAEWETTPMLNLYRFLRNNALSRDKLNYVAGSVKNIHYGDIHTRFHSHFDVTRELVPYVNEAESLPPLTSEDYCAERDLIFADASEDTTDVGKSIEMVCLNEERVLAGQHTILARPTDERLLKGFGGHLFRSRRIRAQIMKESQGTKVYAISATRLGNLEIAFPTDLKEQQKIAECLSSLDELIAAQSRKVDTLKAHKKGLMQQLFPREGETQPRLRFPEFQDAGEWDLKTLGQIVVVASGQVDPKEPPYCNLPQIGSENIESNSGKFVNVKSAGAKGVISGNYAFDERDVLYSKIRPALNKVAAPSFKGVCSADIYPIRPANDGLLRGYLVYLLLTPMFLEYAIRNSERGKIPKINRDGLLAYETQIPSRAEQQAIADFLTSLDAVFSAEAQKLDALKTHKKALMQQLFPTPEATES